MTDTKMKTLGELAKELRGCASTRPDNSGIRRIEIDAADRLERIEKAWRAFDGMTQGNYTEARRRVRAAIEGEP